MVCLIVWQRGESMTHPLLYIKFDANISFLFEKDKSGYERTIRKGLCFGLGLGFLRSPD